MNKYIQENTFSSQSNQYAQARPSYPPELFAWLVQQTYNHDLVWDCATGNGQAAQDLALHFSHVQATDVSEEQITQALPAANITYSVTPAEGTGFSDKCFDLVTVAQALHWFDYALFWPEVRRVAKPGALFCAWGYAWFDCYADVMADFVMPVRDLIAPYWAPNNRILWDGFQDQDIAFPFERILAPKLQIVEQWTIAQLIQYIQTWSAYKKAMQVSANVEKFSHLAAQARVRFDKLGAMKITMPLAIVAARL